MTATTTPDMPLEVEYALKAMEAKHEFEVRRQVAKIRALGEQVQTRLNSLLGRTEMARLHASMAEDQAVYLSNTFGHDTATIDSLLEELSEASQILETMRVAHAAQSALQSEANEKISRLHAEGSQPDQPVVPPVEVSNPGQYL